MFKEPWLWTTIPRMMMKMMKMDHRNALPRHYSRPEKTWNREDTARTASFLITSHSSVEHAVTAIKAGASDYLTKPFRNEDIALRLERVLETVRLKKQLAHAQREQLARFGFDKVIGESAPMKSIFKLVERILLVSDATILLQGESGTGKDVLAKAIHYGGAGQCPIRQHHLHCPAGKPSRVGAIRP